MRIPPQTFPFSQPQNSNFGKSVYRHYMGPDPTAMHSQPHTRQSKQTQCEIKSNWSMMPQICLIWGDHSHLPLFLPSPLRSWHLSSSWIWGVWFQFSLEMTPEQPLGCLLYYIYTYYTILYIYTICYMYIYLYIHHPLPFNNRLKLFQTAY